MPVKHLHSIAFIKRPSLAVLTWLAVVGLVGCSSFNASGVNPVNWITPYKVDVIQGNFISKEQVEMLKTGMSRAQVRDVLGTPLMSSLFHENRWDYVFTLKRQGIAPQSLKYAVFFKGDQLTRFEGDTMPSNAEFIAALANSRKIGKIPVLEATEDQLKKAEKPSVSAASTSPNSKPAAPSAGLQPAIYPPLESVKPQ